MSTLYSTTTNYGHICISSSLFLLYLIITTAAILPSFLSLGYTPETGTFVTKDGSECTWFDLRVKRDQVALATACMCKDRAGTPQSYGCQYTGQLHSCDMYETHSREVLLGLVHQLEALNNSCQLPHLITPHCSQLILEREMLQQPKSPCEWQNKKRKDHKEL